MKSHGIQKRGRVIRKPDDQLEDWIVDEATPTFTADREYLRRNFPKRLD